MTRVWAESGFFYFTQKWRGEPNSSKLVKIAMFWHHFVGQNAFVRFSSKALFPLQLGLHKFNFKSCSLMLNPKGSRFSSKEKKKVETRENKRRPARIHHSWRVFLRRITHQGRKKKIKIHWWQNWIKTSIHFKEFSL